MKTEYWYSNKCTNWQDSLENFSADEVQSTAEMESDQSCGFDSQVPAVQHSVISDQQQVYRAITVISSHQLCDKYTITDRDNSDIFCNFMTPYIKLLKLSVTNAWLFFLLSNGKIFTVNCLHFQRLFQGSVVSNIAWSCCYAQQDSCQFHAISHDQSPRYNLWIHLHKNY